ANGNARDSDSEDNQLDTSYGGANIRDQLLVPRAAENDDAEIVHVDALAIGDGAQVLRRAFFQIYGALGGRAHRDLVHVRVGRVQEIALVGHGDDGEGVRPAGGG